MTSRTAAPTRTPSLARLGSTRLGSTRLGSTRLGSTRLGSTRLGSTRLGPEAGKVAVFALLLFGGCTPPVGITDLAIVEGYRVDPTFNAFTEPCEIRYTLQEPALVQIRVVRVAPDGTRELVRQITEERRETAGPRTAAWRGVGPNGLFAPQGEYHVELFARLDGSERTEEWTLTTIMFRT